MKDLAPFKNILSNIARHIPLDESEKHFFVALLKRELLAKKSSIQNAGRLCDRITFVCSGTLRAYHLDQDDKEATIMFAVADWWITDIYAFTNHLPAMLTIEALEESEVLHLHKKDFEFLLKEVPKFERFFRIIFQNAYVREQLRTIQNLSLVAEERYHLFLQKYPQVVKQVTQKQIASYLGITPEFLSAIRKNKK
jgi:CRP-like cAMP-binding protein